MDEERRDTEVVEVREVEVVGVVEEAPHNRGELIKFGILALVLLGTVLIVALARPLIFNQIVPAIMGEGQQVVPSLPPAEEATDADTDDEEREAYPVLADEESSTDAYPAPDHESFIPALGGTGDSYPAPEEEEQGVETAVITHTVQASENLTRIAEQYEVTVQAIIDFNNITNPNRIEAGTVLQIPVQSEQ
ncbi:MAG: LysM domain-containing protein [Chloroflexota bacterium]